jgi:hypothetical protein
LRQGAGAGGDGCRGTHAWACTRRGSATFPGNSLFLFWIYVFMVWKCSWRTHQGKNWLSFFLYVCLCINIMLV